MLICITGAGYVSKKAAEDLIRDFISIPDPGPVTFMLPSYMTTDGLRNVRDVVKDMDHVVVSYKKSVMPEMFRTYADRHKAVFILDADTDRDFLEESGAELMYDLSRGLFPVAPPVAQDSLHTALGATETDEQVRSGVIDRTGEYDTLESLTELPVADADWVTRIDTMSYEQLRGLEEAVRHAVHIREQNMHPVYTGYKNGTKFHSREMEEAGAELTVNMEPLYQDVPATAGTVEALAHTVEMSQQETVKYWKSKAGKYRKAGKSKSRPGETEIWLTQEEIDKL
jgi:hypothetical protein